ncbi:carbohydrate ABC transporter permease [Xylanivirga thermophila]|uniref:carbohydrate ABC transporter permease n=1 Tax=Xylanivirga thermophila TaxID=2496273 RepID=UPI00101D9877|nr:sugar ABC transporter permease [Xylanivirga thermophila]
MKQSKGWFFLFVGPIFLIFLIVVLIPMFMGVYYSFTDWNGIKSNGWVGLSNYINIFTQDKYFKKSFMFTLKFATISMLVINLLGFCLALLVTRGIKRSNALRSIFFMPNLIGGLILGFVWQFIFINGFNFIGKALNIKWLQGWLSDPVTGFWGLIILMSWQMSGYMMVIYISALENISESLLEAAEIDGANVWHVLTNIIFPLVAPAFTIGMFLTLSNSFKLFDQNLALTAGGPYNSTQMLALNIYNTAFSFNKYGIAQAKAIIFLLLVGTITLTQMYINKKREVEM